MNEDTTEGERAGSTEPTGAEVFPGAEQPVEPAQAGEARKPGLFARAFSKETRFGRFMRVLTRTLALVVGLFALGFLAGYILLYQPAQRQLQNTQADLAAERTRVGELESARDDAQARLDELQQRYDTAQAGLDGVTARMHLARMANSVSLARYALTNRDSSAAQKALKEAQAEYEALRPAAEKKDPDGTAAIKMRLDLVVSELPRDSKVALSDLAILSDSLTVLDGVLAK